MNLELEDFLHPLPFAKGLPCFRCGKPVEGEYELIIKTRCSPNSKLYEVTEYLCHSCFEELKDAKNTSS